jgi:hypothetical protein
MPLGVRCDPQLPNKMMQREHGDEATGALPATFLNEKLWGIREGGHHPASPTDGAFHVRAQ